MIRFVHNQMGKVMKITINTDKTYNVILPDNRLYKVTLNNAGIGGTYRTEFCGKIDPKKYKQGKKVNRIPNDLKTICDLLISDVYGYSLFGIGVLNNKKIIK